MTDFELTTLEYLRDCVRRGLREATIKYYRDVLERFSRVSGTTDLSQLTRGSVRAFQDDLADLSPGSVKGFVSAIKTFSKWAHEERHEPDPLAGLRLPRSDRHLVIVPTDAELVSLMAASAPLLRTVVTLVAGTGLRISDVVGLDLADLRPSALVVARPKNRIGRLVPLDPVMADVLCVYVRDVRDPAARSLFTSRTGGRLTPNAVRQALTAASKRAAISLAISPHVLRHWHARDLANHETTDRLIVARMGWASVGLMARYAPVTDAEVVRDTERYAPVSRLCEAGLLRGLFPGALSAPGRAQRSKNVEDDNSAAAWRSRVGRHS